MPCLPRPLLFDPTFPSSEDLRCKCQTWPPAKPAPGEAGCGASRARRRKRFTSSTGKTGRAPRVGATRAPPSLIASFRPASWQASAGEAPSKGCRPRGLLPPHRKEMLCTQDLSSGVWAAVVAAVRGLCCTPPALGAVARLCLRACAAQLPQSCRLYSPVPNTQRPAPAQLPHRSWAGAPAGRGPVCSARAAWQPSPSPPPASTAPLGRPLTAGKGGGSFEMARWP